MQEHTQHKTETQQAAGFSDAGKQMGTETKTLLAPGLYPGLSAPQQLQEMANKSKQVTQLHRCQQLITKHNSVSKTAGVVQAMFLTSGNTAITTLAGLNTELAKLNDENGTPHPSSALKPPDFIGNPSPTQLDNAIAKCQGKIRDYMSLQDEVIPMINSTITSMNQSATAAATTTGGGSGAAASSATSTNASSQSNVSFDSNNSATWIMQPLSVAHNLRNEDLGVSDADLANLRVGQLGGQHAGSNITVDTGYHVHAHGGTGGIAFGYKHEAGTSNVTPVIYDHASTRKGNDYNWKNGGTKKGPPDFTG